MALKLKGQLYEKLCALEIEMHEVKDAKIHGEMIELLDEIISLVDNISDEEDGNNE